jgi:transposase
MGQRARILTEIFGFRGWKVVDAFFEDEAGRPVSPPGDYALMPCVRLVLRVKRAWLPRCSQCGAACGAGGHEKLATRRWADLPWAGRPIQIEATPMRVKCKKCQASPVEMLAWADPHQRQSRRLQHHLALQAASMPVLHVAAQSGLTWGIVRRAEGAALARWQAARANTSANDTSLRNVGLDEKWLGRRHKLEHKYVTVVSDLDTGEPIWIGPGRGEDTVKQWLATLTTEQKAGIKLFAADMHAPFRLAIRADPALAHAAFAHDPFHLVKRANEAVTEMRREAFFRATPELRSVGRGTRWLVLRAWERAAPEQQERLRKLFSYNQRLGRAYQVVDEYRAVLRAPDRNAMVTGLARILRRTQERQNVPLRKWHDSIRAHMPGILALGEHRPPAGRIEALNNNWESLVRRARGYRDHQYLLLKLRFMVVNPIRTEDGTKRFLALGLPPPMKNAA